MEETHLEKHKQCLHSMTAFTLSRSFRSQSRNWRIAIPHVPDERYGKTKYFISISSEKHRNPNLKSKIINHMLISEGGKKKCSAYFLDSCSHCSECQQNRQPKKKEKKTKKRDSFFYLFGPSYTSLHFVQITDPPPPPLPNKPHLPVAPEWKGS